MSLCFLEYSSFLLPLHDFFFSIQSIRAENDPEGSCSSSETLIKVDAAVMSRRRAVSETSTHIPGWVHCVPPESFFPCQWDIGVARTHLCAYKSHFQGISVQPCLTWSSQRPTCLWSAGIKGVRHCARLSWTFLRIYAFIYFWIKNN